MRQSSVIAQGQSPLPAFFGPVSGYTWEVAALLAGSALETDRIPIELKGPIEILGFYPSVSLVGDEVTGSVLVNGVPRKPTVDDLMVMLDINQETRLTNRLESTTIENALRSFVTLGALSVKVPRLVRVQLTTARPDIGLQFRWGQAPIVAQTEIYHDVIVRLAFYCRYLPLEAI